MAALDSTITIKAERRPCFVHGKKAMFHCWTHEQELVGPSAIKGGHNGGAISATLGIVEFEDGHVGKAAPNSIVFADGGEFHITCWMEQKEG